MLSNAYLLAKFRFDTAENERNVAENLPKTDVPPEVVASRTQRSADILKIGIVAAKDSFEYPRKPPGRARRGRALSTPDFQRGNFMLL